MAIPKAVVERELIDPEERPVELTADFEHAVEDGYATYLSGSIIDNVVRYQDTGGFLWWSPSAWFRRPLCVPLPPAVAEVDCPAPVPVNTAITYPWG